MSHNATNSETVHLKIVSKKSHAVRPRPAVSGRTACVPAATRALEMPDLRTFIKVIDDYQRMLQCTQDQMTLLAEQNAGLRKALDALTQKEAQARHLAHHDGLTGLPNRSLLQDRFDQALSQAVRHSTPLGLLMVDLDQFKCVNDQLGHACGDKLLQAVAVRLNQGVRGADTACRYGGDEFVIMLPVMDSADSATLLATKMMGRLGEPYIIDGHKIQLDVSIGEAVYPRDGLTLDVLLKQADAAMYRTKGTGNGTRISALPKENMERAASNDPLTVNNADLLRASTLFTQH